MLLSVRECVEAVASVDLSDPDFSPGPRGASETEPSFAALLRARHFLLQPNHVQAIIPLRVVVYNTTLAHPPHAYIAAPKKIHVVAHGALPNVPNRPIVSVTVTNK